VITSAWNGFVDTYAVIDFVRADWKYADIYPDFFGTPGRIDNRFFCHAYPNEYECNNKPLFAYILQTINPKMMTEINSFIFLDFDGVVNTENYQMRLTRSNKQRKDKYGPVFDPDTVRRLGRIIKATGAKVCLISSWAYEGEEKMKALWKERNMPGQLFAICCNMPWVIPEINVKYAESSLDMMVGKGRDVLSFLSSVQGDYSYVILDDVPDFFPEQEAHYVQINPKTGITDDDAIRAIHILLSKNIAKGLNSPESFKNEIEDSFDEDFKKVHGTMLDV